MRHRFPMKFEESSSDTKLALQRFFALNAMELSTRLIRQT